MKEISKSTKILITIVGLIVALSTITLLTAAFDSSDQIENQTEMNSVSNVPNGASSASNFNGF